MSSDARKVELERLGATARRLFGVRPRKVTAEEREALKRASRDPEEHSRRYRIEEGRVKRVR